MVAVLSATLLGDVAMGGPPGRPDWTPPKGADVPGVATVDARAVERPAWPAQAESRTVRGPQRVTWPDGRATVDLAGPAAARAAGGRVAAGALPVRLAHVADREDGSGVAKATVTVYDRATTAKANVDGLLFGVERVDGVARAGKLTVEVGYAGFAAAYGGDWASRLRLVQLPSCALSVASDKCRTVRPLRTVNNPKAGTVTAEVTVAAGAPAVLAVQAAPSGPNGDYAATTLSPAGTWNVGAQSGDFTHSYPMRMPPGLGGPTPSVALSYSSGSVDGRTSTTNNQTGWIGDGWDFWPGFIERKYASCTDDSPTRNTGDLCWGTDNASLSLSGHAGELIETGTPGVWRLKDDDGTRVEKLTDPARANGDDNNEYWKVTTTDGTQYYFGYHRTNGWGADSHPTTNATWTVPVYGNGSGEPCSSGAGWCQQAWRWNLDYVIDPHDNTMAYYYQKEAGWYGRDQTPSLRTEYVRGGWLDRIEYGTRKGAEYTAPAPVRVVFDARERCFTGCWSGPAWNSAPIRSAWADVPWDRDCAAAPCTGNLSPTFWSARRLASVTTQVRSGPNTYRDVESWTLRHEFLNAGDNEGAPMWLRGITHAGHVTSDGTAVTEPETIFAPGAEPLPNRVDGPTDGLTSLTRFRIKTITTSGGGQITVNYSGPDCTRGSLPIPESNTKRCMPVYWSPVGASTTLDWFHKYVVTHVRQVDVQYQDIDGHTVAKSEDQEAFYDYLDTPAWHYTDDELTPNNRRTWGDWRGYGRVQVRNGTATGQQTATEYRYLRGMDGDKQPTGTRDVWVDDTWGGHIEDHEAHHGFLRQVITWQGPGGAEVSSTVNDPWRMGPTATRNRNGSVVNAWQTEVASSRTRTALYAKDGTARGHRTTKTTTEYNNDGQPIATTNFGDEATSGDETCQRQTYARNDAIWMLDRVAQTETLTGTCAAATTPAAKEKVLNRSRTFYDTYTDESSFGAPPTKGDPKRIEELDHWNGTTPVYVATATNTFDENGRLKAVADARGNTATTGYTVDAATGLVTGTTVTDPLGHRVITTTEPAWGLPTRIIDDQTTDQANPKHIVTDVAYDGLGRVGAVWLPGRDKASQGPNRRFTYRMRSSGGPSAVTTETLLSTGDAYRTSISLLDGFLRQRQNQLQATGGGRIITETLHNSLGQVGWTSAAYHDSTGGAPETTIASPQGQIPAVSRTVHDGAGRPTATIFLANGAEKWRTTIGYGGDRTFHTPPAGGTATATLTDARGRTIELRQYKAPADLGSDNPAAFTRTAYTHTLLDQLTTLVDQGGNVWSYDYDLRGRQYRAKDPDKGITESTYDAAGNVETVTMPFGTGTATLAFTYDALGRKTSVRDDTVGGPIRAEWVYDTLPYGKGKLTSATRHTSAGAYTNRVNAYDQYGRPTSTSVVLPASETALCAAARTACTYTSTTTYGLGGQQSTATLPAAADLPSEKLTFGYTDVDDPGTVYSASQIYVDAVDYNQLGQLTSRVLGASGARLALTNTYDEPTRRLTNASVVPEAAPEAANYSYTYDPAGNTTAIREAPSGQAADQQCFTYDYLRRLTQAWTPTTADCQAAPTQNQVGGPAPYWHDWTIDDLGNRRTETRHAASGNTTYTYAYPTPGPTTVRPHAVQSVSASGAVTWNRAYTYDNAGNTATRPTATGATQTLTFDREGHLAKLLQGTDTSTYLYDADGKRLIRTDPGGAKTLYLGTTEVRATASTTTATRYYTHAGATIAVRTAAGLHWLVSDHHGTAELTVNATNLAVAKRRTLPYGEQRGTNIGTWASGMDKGFVGGTTDPTGLTHLGAREYDPFLGRFVSVDPVMDLTDPQQMHGYAYSNNSPTTWADPTGLLACEDSECTKTTLDRSTPSGPRKVTCRIKNCTPHDTLSQRGRQCWRGCRPHDHPSDQDIEYAGLAVKWGNEFGIDPVMLLAVILRESSDGWKSWKIVQGMQASPSIAGLADLLGVDEDGGSVGITNVKFGVMTDVAEAMRNSPVYGKYAKDLEGKMLYDVAWDDSLSVEISAFAMRIEMDRLESGSAKIATNNINATPIEAASAFRQANGGGGAVISLDRSDSMKPGVEQHIVNQRNIYVEADRIICQSGIWAC
ncbi:hypothetical protein Prum_075820 [Phytohabitans rumicis]|uniref:Teneurin-like YD-shell domain-containing protein n=2 Tax=Phytohabitans rumicis TaxID=1076125 RepID=A0A6V8LE57_9ACTN|nr:RHS repeat-associated core domain-containing protein [Phytohabitans rumicis]GFJ93940.1 hypothetical protein Prum_075820 [Phytohabitans rumicis]